MPSVRIEAEAFSDWRYEKLGQLLGTSRYDALGRMAYVWRHCTERQSHTVTASALDGIGGVSGFAAAMMAADLGEEGPDGIRVKGAEGRIEWLAEIRANAKKGGEANKKRFATGLTKTSRLASQEASQTDSRLASQMPSPLTLALTQKKEREEPPLEGSHDRIHVLFGDLHLGFNGQRYTRPAAFNDWRERRLTQELHSVGESEVARQARQFFALLRSDAKFRERMSGKPLLDGFLNSMGAPALVSGGSEKPAVTPLAARIAKREEDRLRTEIDRK